ncbi:hypothetical protein VCRA2126O84_1180001 [Vibrio crassostreae]|nr:hypothetical protein VCRA2126O84_1180001 [Vibrio crassostreae]CAK2610344.1 hypothetical protein VCRA2128O106_1310001 [Vibrio crassostreae]CAK3153646.1 hypothetical protein VCRA2127O89_1190001 [Vibrio crassostreae]CAK3185405.1 hypothetical protein VCRA2126O87_1220001 [Vibrio crassostreae]CAK3208179.1 hypothetical protein VCRA2125O80_1520001 [Vibrio crassostreae]
MWTQRNTKRLNEFEETFKSVFQIILPSVFKKLKVKAKFAWRP